jgi:hypothetical protein
MATKKRKSRRSKKGLGALGRMRAEAFPPRLRAAIKELPGETHQSVLNAVKHAARGNCNSAVTHLLDAATDTGILLGSNKFRGHDASKALTVAGDVILRSCGVKRGKRYGDL